MAHWRGLARSRTTAFLSFVVCFALGIRLVAALAPSSEPALLAERLAEFDAERDVYDTVFIGSSRIFRGVDPVTFDRRTASLGHPTNSFNLGFPAMLPHEANAVLRRFLQRPPSGLRWVIIELAEWSPKVVRPLPDESFVNSGRYSERALAWHDGPETISVLRSVVVTPAAWTEKLRLALLHAAHWGARSLHVGDGARAARRVLTPGAEATSAAGSSRGFTPFDDRDYVEGFPAIFRGAFESAIDTYRWSVASRRAADAEKAPIGEFNVQALLDQIEMVRRAGARPIYVLPPRGDATPQLNHLHERGLVPDLLDLNDPRRYPDLFSVEVRFDQQHLNPRGAEMFSRHLGESFASWLSSH